jgi:hypothetical protein
MTSKDVIRDQEWLELFDSVSKPSHYADCDVECIDAMCSAFGQHNVALYARINAFKYIWRAAEKHSCPDEDIKKAIWYLKFSIGEDPRAN